MPRVDAPPPIPIFLQRILQSSLWSPAAFVAAAVFATALADWAIGLNLSLGALYVIPILVAGAVYSRLTIVLLSILCSSLRIAFGNAASFAEASLNFLLVMSAYIGSGFLIHEIVRNRRAYMSFATQLQLQQDLRRQAEDQLRLLAESSPAAILTADQHGRILAINQSGLHLFGADSEDALRHQNIAQLLPVLHTALQIAASSEPFRTATQCQGRRLDGSPFHAQLWFSTYSTPEGRRLAAIAVDSSDEIREREESNLRQLLTSNRILTGAVLHEIRNLCASISSAFANLTAAAGFSDSRESAALANMIAALGRLASTNLHSTREHIGPIRLAPVLDQFRIVAEPAWVEVDGSFFCPPDSTPLPPVLADPQGLLQVLLNLMSNSLRAAASSSHPRFTISAHLLPGKVVLAAEDSGPGIPNPEALFVPFQSGADRVGLGLYLSRAILRSFGGDLRHVPTSAGCRFEIDLQIANSPSETHLWLT